ncbi:unnamed protein product, partial [Ectocarpus fasciculatus]
RTGAGFLWTDTQTDVFSLVSRFAPSMLIIKAHTRDSAGFHATSPPTPSNGYPSVRQCPDKIPFLYKYVKCTEKSCVGNVNRNDVPNVEPRLAPPPSEKRHSAQALELVDNKTAQV